jgi:hypothetical protein
MIAKRDTRKKIAANTVRTNPARTTPKRFGHRFICLLNVSHVPRALARWLDGLVRFPLLPLWAPIFTNSEAKGLIDLQNYQFIFILGQDNAIRSELGKAVF